MFSLILRRFDATRGVLAVNKHAVRVGAQPRHGIMIGNNKHVNHL